MRKGKKKIERKSKGYRERERGGERGSEEMELTEELKIVYFFE